MNLADASRYFDQTLATDVTTGQILFRCQVDPYDDSKRDASQAYRRVMSVAPGTRMPASGVIRLLGETWIIGSHEPDGMRNLHRQKYVLHMTTEQLKLSRLSGFLSGSVVATLHCAPGWVKDAKQLEVSSEMPQLFDITLPQGTSVAAHDILWSATEAYLVLSPRPLASGLAAANCLKLDQVAPLAANVSARVYNPSAGTYGTPVVSPVNALKVRWQNMFEYASQMSERFQEGDSAIVLPTGTTLSTSSLIELSGVTYQVLAVMSIASAVVAHARRV